MKLRSIILASIAVLPIATSPVSWATGGSMGAQPQPQAPPPQTQRPTEGELWQQLDQTMQNVQRKREQEAEAERIERGISQHPSGGPMSRGEMEANREHFLEKNRAAERRLSSVVHKREALVNDMLKMYSKHPSPGLADAIKRNSEKLSTERNELNKSRQFIERNR